MIFYIFFLVFIIILCGRYNIVSGYYIVSKETGFKLAILFIITVSCLRFNIGYDWSVYFSFVYPVYTPQNIGRFEPLSKLIIYCAGTLHQPLILFSVYAIVTYVNIGIIIDTYSESKFEALMLYVCFFYLITLSTIRQAAAASIIFYGFKYIDRKKIFNYILVCAFASLFHKTAMIGVLFYPLYYSSLIICFFLLVCTYVCARVLLPAMLKELAPFFLLYLERGGVRDSSGSFQRMVYLFMYIYALIFHRKKMSGILNICTIGMALPFILGGHTGGRLAEYFLIYYCLLIPDCNKRFSIQYRVLFMIPLYAYFFMYLLVSVFANHSNEYVPFRWYFLENLDQKLM